MFDPPRKNEGKVASRHNGKLPRIDYKRCGWVIRSVRRALKALDFQGQKLLIAFAYGIVRAGFVRAVQLARRIWSAERAVSTEKIMMLQCIERRHGRRSFWSIALVLVVGLSACSGGGGGAASPTTQNTPPANVALIEASSISVGDLSVSWLSASDGSTPAADIQYQVHASTSSDFVPDGSTLKFEGRGANSANLTGLTPGAQYAIRLVAIDQDGARTISSPLSVRISSVASDLQAGVVVQPLASTQASVVSDSQVSLATGVPLPLAGQFIASDDGNGYLKQVTAVTNTAGQTVLETRDASINEVVSDVEVSSNFRMLSIPKEVESAALITGLVSKRAGQSGPVTDYTWKETGFRYSASSNPAATSTSPRLSSARTAALRAGLVASTSAIVQQGAWGKISAPSNVAVSEDELATFKLTVAVTDRSKPLIGTPVTVCKVELGAVWSEGDGSNPSGISITKGALEVVQSVPETGAVVTAYQPITLIAAAGTANIAPYKVKATLYLDDSGDGCSGDNYGSLWRETLDLPLEILVVNDAFPETESVSKTFDGTADFQVTNDVKLSFSPAVSFDQRLSGARLQYARIEVSGAPRVEQTLHITATAAGTMNKTLDLITPRKFFKVYVAGGVPIVVSGTYRLQMHIAGDVNGEIDATERLTIGYDKLKYGIQYENGVYSRIKDVQPVYRLNIGGNGQAEANLEISLQPSMEVTAYQAVTGQVMLEPYLAAHAGIEGHVQLDTEVDFNTLQTNMAADADYRLTRGELGGGVRAYLYADFRVWDKVLAAWPDNAQADDYETHEKIDLLPETVFLGIPGLNGSVDWAAVHPTDSRAILVKAVATNVANPLKALFGGLPDAYVTWAAWTNPRIVPPLGVAADSYSILPSPTGNGAEAWVVLQQPATYTVRQGGYSNWGTWARQYVETTVDVPDANANGIPDWWEARYGLTGATGAAIASADPEGDGASNLQEWQAGTYPNQADAPPTPPAAASALVSHWSFDDCTANDQSGNLLHGAISGAPVCAAGVKGQALRLNGASDWISVASSNKFPTTAVTMAYWLKREGQAPVGVENYVSKELAFQSYLQANQQIQSGLWKGAPGEWSSYVSGTLLPSLSDWVFYAFTFDNSTMTANSYINGVIVATSVENDPNAIVRVSSQPMYLGRNGSAGVYFVKGMLDEVRVYDRALSAAEVDALYQEGALASTPAAPQALTDTGITTAQCYQAGSDVLVACNSAEALALNNAQDGMRGRDVSSPDNTDGKLGFSYSTVGAYGLTECVQDHTTGLMWEGKTATGTRAESNAYTNWGDSRVGDASAYVTTVNAAGLCGYNDWRLPTADELQTLVDYGVATPGPTIDSTWFQNAGGWIYWSSSPYVGDPNSAWGVVFGSGGVFDYSRDSSGHVRLVRAGQSPIPNRYTVSADEQEVTDNQTSLIWRRCAEGMTVSGGTCIGTVGTFTHEAALQHATAQAGSSGKAWRLPNVKELSSISDRSRINPAIDTTAFPATTYWYWSSSPAVGIFGGARYVYFGDGDVGVGNDRRSYGHVRLVRAGQ